MSKQYQNPTILTPIVITLNYLQSPFGIPYKCFVCFWWIPSFATFEGQKVNENRTFCQSVNLSQTNGHTNYTENRKNWTSLYT